MVLSNKGNQMTNEQIADRVAAFLAKGNAVTMVKPRIVHPSKQLDKRVVRAVQRAA